MVPSPSSTSETYSLRTKQEDMFYKINHIFVGRTVYSTACKFTLFVPCVILAHEATYGNCETASPTFLLTDISIRGRQTNSQVIVSGVPSRREKKSKDA